MTVSIPGPEIRALATVQQLADDYAGRAKAPRTVRAYATDWRDFVAWADAHRRQALPAAPDTVAMYLADLAARGVRPSTLARRLVAISQAHKTVDLASPTTSSAVRRTFAGIRRSVGIAQTTKAPVVVDHLVAMVEASPSTLRGLRDCALLLLGFAGAFRRSELVSLDVADLAHTRAGLVVTVRRSKTDQEAAGRRVGVPFGSSETTCPVTALQAWLEAANITSGAVFRPLDRAGRVQDLRLSDKAVARLVKRHASAIGLDPKRYAGHSLRAGLATSAAAAGASERSIMAQTGHRSLPMVRRYIRDGELFRENAAAKVL